MEKYNKKTCRCCSSPMTIPPLLTYHNMPAVAQNFPDRDSLESDCGKTFDIFQCPYCGLVQILQEPVYYYKDVIRAAAVSDEMKDFRKDYFKRFVEDCGLQGKKVIEIGAGCGEYMLMAAQNDMQVYGLEHLRESVIKARELGLAVFEGYVEDADYKIPESPYDGFFILNFLEHVPEPREFLKGIASNLRDGAYGLVEVPNADFIMENKMFSEFMIDHLSYFTKDTLRLVLEMSGFEVKSCEVIWKDYIISAVVRKRSLFDADSFLKRESELLSRIDEFLKEMEKKGRKAAIWGAGHQALAVMAFAGLGDKIECVIDSAGFKQNRYTPASHIPVYGPEKISGLGIGAVLVIAGSYSDEVCRVIESRHKGVLAEKLF